MLHADRETGGCARAAPSLLAHLSLLFVLYGGAMLATSARLKWDPTTYIVVRELLPTEYRIVCALLPLAGVAFIAFAHLAVAALTARDRAVKRTLYLIYALCMGVALVSEIVFGVLAAVHVQAWLRTEVYHHLQQTLEVREHLLQLLAALERWHPLPNQIKELLQEAEADLPWNGYVCAAAAVLLLLAQLAAVVLALVAQGTLTEDSKYSRYHTTHSRNSVVNQRRGLLEPGFR